MSISTLQPSFAAGELSPLLYGRVDLAKYQVGLKLCSNFMVLPFGGVSNRPGTYFAAPTKSNAVARLIRFKFNSQDAYALEFTNLLMRVYRNGGLVLNTGGPNIGLPFELVTPFTEAELWDINFSQSADVMIMVNTLRKPQKLSRLGHDNWTIADLSLVPSIIPPASATATAVAGVGATQVWKYQITAIKDDGSNAIEESLPVTSGAITVFATTLTGNLVWPAAAGATYYNVYKDSTGGGIYGFIGRSAALAFSDVNIGAVKTDTPPNGNDPFIGAGNFPSSVGYFQQRLVFGGTLNKPQTNWFSKTGVFNNFGYSIPSKDDDAITWTIASTEVNRIRHYTALKDLLTFTDGAEWSIQGGSAGLTSKTINGAPQTYNGIGKVPPLVVNNNVLYVQESGTQVTSFSYSFESDGFSGTDTSILSRHLLEDYSIVDWGYQNIPYGVIWATRQDGELLGITYNPSQDVTAWHHHETDGFFESVCCVPEGRETSVYVVVRRIINGVTKRYVERMVSRQVPKRNGAPDIALAFFVDSGLTYNGRNVTEQTVTISGGTTWQYPETLTATRSAGAWSVGDVGKQIHFDKIGDNDPLRFDITAYLSPTTVSVIPLGLVPVSQRNAPVLLWGMAVSTLAGLSHLEGKTVSVLGDGNVLPPVVVTGGSITVSQDCQVMHVGLPYQSDMQTLEININGQETLLDKNKTVNSVTLEVNESRGILAGQDADHLWEFKQRDFEPLESPIDLLTGKARIQISQDWTATGSVYVRQEDPLPLTILAIIPELTIGGKA